jgi:hypothetical protein
VHRPPLVRPDRKLDVRDLLRSGDRDVKHEQVASLLPTRVRPHAAADVVLADAIDRDLHSLLKQARDADGQFVRTIACLDAGRYRRLFAGRGVKRRPIRLPPRPVERRPRGNPHELQRQPVRQHHLVGRRRRRAVRQEQRKGNCCEQ